MEKGIKRFRRVTNLDWKEVITNYLGKVCNYCGEVKRLHIHHILPLSKGGSNSLGNLEVVCIPCHHKIHKQIESVIPKKKVKYEWFCGFCSYPSSVKLTKTKGLCKHCYLMNKL